MLTLAIECSAKAASAAVSEDGKILGEFYINTAQTHSETLMPMVKNLLESTKKSQSDIDLYAVTAGPGSFTGVRIGIACIKGMAFEKETPCCAVSTLEAIAYGACSCEGMTISAVMDARREQVYNALFRIENSVPKRLCEDRAISIESLLTECKNFGETVLFVGDGAEICYNISEKSGYEFLRLAPQSIRFQRASSVAFAAERSFLENRYIFSSKDISPVYLRMPQAERELKKRQNNPS